LFQSLSKVTVTSCSFYIQYSMCSSCCWTTYSKNVLFQKLSCFQLLLFRHWNFTRFAFCSRKRLQHHWMDDTFEVRWDL